MIAYPSWHLNTSILSPGRAPRQGTDRRAAGPECAARQSARPAFAHALLASGQARELASGQARERDSSSARATRTLARCSR